ncbi:MAG: hypothetical protein ACK2UW_04355 [Anaerolineales bacterium]|jgi:hypothetical protein
MDDIRQFRIRILGQVEEAELNARSPLYLKVASSDKNATDLALEADQAGVIGVLRHLHGLGFVLLSLDGAIPE